MADASSIFADMRTHVQIIEDAGGAERLAGLLGLPSVHTARAWRQRQRIPASWWMEMQRLGLATTTELAIMISNQSAEKVA